VSRFVAYRERAAEKLQCYPTKTLFDVLRKTETVLRTVTDNFTNIRDLPKKEIMYNMRMYFVNDCYFPECRECMGSLYHVNHKLELINQIVYTVIFFSGMQHGIKPFLEFSPNDRKIFRASAEYSRISFVQNEFRLNSRNSVETGKIHGFTGLILIRPNFVP
jgi:hypothetical protein